MSINYFNDPPPLLSQRHIEFWEHRPQRFSFLSFMIYRVDECENSKVFLRKSMVRKIFNDTKNEMRLTVNVVKITSNWRLITCRPRCSHHPDNETNRPDMFSVGIFLIVSLISVSCDRFLLVTRLVSVGGRATQYLAPTHNQALLRESESVLDDVIACLENFVFN